MTNKSHCQIGEKTLLAVSKNPANISFLVKCVGISLLVFGLVVGVGAVIFASRYINNHLCNLLQ